jgi:hypothetical protein
MKAKQVASLIGITAIAATLGSNNVHQLEQKKQQRYHLKFNLIQKEI